MSECDVCNDFALLQKATCDEKSYRWSVVKTLCFIVALLETEEEELPATTTVLPQVVKTAAQLTSSYSSFASTGLLDTTKQLNKVRVVNNTDADLDFSYDGGAETAFTVLAYSTYQEDLNMILSGITSFQMKIADSQTAGVGSVYIEGRYNS